jgi:hypothetical protein
MNRISTFVALLVSLTCCAGVFAQGSDSPGTYIGRKYWYEPAHEKYAPVEFHRVPDFDRGMFNIQKKSKFEVVETSRGWLKLRFESSAYSENIAYLPVRILRSRLYAPTVGETVRETFRKAAIFEEDPDVIQRRLDAVAVPAEKSTTPPPWVIRNRRVAPPAPTPPPTQ